ncbi:hypothetical protein TVAG_466050 [Trichomonas vaginalis G3]|uniref:Uncharacterized protein n=1 Tax=Trichomonas vaginalis (strain ATCC PRA-98 / G3) TaxID=412133 RepID=A2EX86_TRIV3|nr:Ankyrin repeat family [Trichomonas vaginalis G3]EAY02745.1 hypothetical protein TVAG_466050 [Trichomonas vaginalis G3]KAI5517246.1 Ankyrin repeat family [Trichomonas vaginalis G3]|eukprot:XP_001314968.1 hypothetical protein [Trichomonas vaginalis G3]
MVESLILNNGKYLVDVDTKCNNDKTALHLAAINNSIEIAEFLISHGANMDVTDIENYTPFQCAIRNYHREIIKIFILNGADANTRVEKGYSILYFAIIFGDKEMIEFLISNGIDINSVVDADGRAALHFSLWINSQYINNYPY